MNIKENDIPSACLSTLVNINARQRAFYQLLIEILYKDEPSKVDGVVRLLNDYEAEEKSLIWMALYSHYGSDPLDLPDGIAQS